MKRYAELDRRKNITQNKKSLEAKTFIKTRWENNIRKTQPWLEAIEKRKKSQKFIGERKEILMAGLKNIHPRFVSDTKI
jgi:hypothetical protein